MQESLLVVTLLVVTVISPAVALGSHCKSPITLASSIVAMQLQTRPDYET